MAEFPAFDGRFDKPYYVDEEIAMSIVPKFYEIWCAIAIYPASFESLGDYHA